MSVRGFFCSSCEQYFEFAEAKDVQKKSRYGRMLSCACSHCAKRLEPQKVGIMKYLLFFFYLACGATIFMLGLEQLSPSNRVGIILWMTFYFFCLYWWAKWWGKNIGLKVKGFGKGFGAYVLMLKAPENDLSGDLAEEMEDIKP